MSFAGMARMTGIAPAWQEDEPQGAVRAARDMVQGDGIEPPMRKRAGLQPVSPPWGTLHGGSGTSRTRPRRASCFRDRRRDHPRPTLPGIPFSCQRAENLAECPASDADAFRRNRFSKPFRLPAGCPLQRW